MRQVRRESETREGPGYEKWENYRDTKGEKENNKEGRKKRGNGEMKEKHCISF